MPFVSLTRLRLRSIRFLPLFALHTMRSLRQIRAAAGYQHGSLLPDRHWTFWTMTAWDSQASMRHYMTTGAHKEAMPRLMYWCDEASVTHWEQAEPELPSWTEAETRMRSAGRASKVLHPSPAHPTLAFAAARTSRAAPIRRS